MKSLFVTATNTDIGKTYTTLKLIEEFTKQGIRVGVFKPIETGVIEEPEDAKILLKAVQKHNPKFKELNPHDITAYTFSLASAPYSADKEKIIKIKTILKKIEALKKNCDLLIIEGAGGLFVPIQKEYMMIDLIKESNSMALLVTPSKLGCINDTLLNIEALKIHQIPFNWTVNLLERDKINFQEITKPFYDEAFPHWWSIENGLENFVHKYINS